MTGIEATVGIPFNIHEKGVNNWPIKGRNIRSLRFFFFLLCFFYFREGLLSDMGEGILLHYENLIFSPINNKLEIIGYTSTIKHVEYAVLSIVVNGGNKNAPYPGMHSIMFI